MRRSHNTSIATALLQSGVNPDRLKALIENCLEVEQSYFSLAGHVLPESEYYERELSIIEAQIFCLLISQS